MGKQENRAFDYSRWTNWIDPKEAIPYDKNAKIHDEEQVRNIANSIRRFGWQQDTVLTRDKVLVIGHGRRLAALELGCMLPYHIVDKDADELTAEDIRELRFADNLTNESPWDYAIGALDMEGLSFDGFDFDLDDFAFDGADETEKAEKEESANPTENLPESRVYVFGLSAFGVNSECFVHSQLSQNEADRVLEALATGRADEIAEKLKEALNAL